MVARQSADTPDGTNCSSRASTAWQPTNRNSPTAPEPSHSAGRGHAESGSRRRERPSRMPPPIRQRTAIIGNGGIVSTAQAMARKGGPQTREKAADAATTRGSGNEEGMGVGEWDGDPPGLPGGRGGPPD